MRDLIISKKTPSSRAGVVLRVGSGEAAGWMELLIPLGPEVEVRVYRVNPFD